MSVHALRPIRGLPGGQRQPLVGSRVVAMSIFAFTEAMLFAGLISAFTIVRAGAPVWPPPGQPRLPVEATAVNTAALLASALLLFLARRRFRRVPQQARRPLLASLLLGACFVLFQGVEWVALVGQGLTVTSSTLGSFFYLVVGLHALHAVAALGLLLWAWLRIQRGWASSDLFAAATLFWYFVVGLWPVLYWRVYL